MLKWILGIILVLVVAVMGTCWYGYSKLTSEGQTATVLVATTPDRAWRYYTMPDSFRVWQDSTMRVTFSTDSTELTVGDTVWLDSQVRTPTGSTSRMTWVLEQMDMPRTLVWAARDDSTRAEIVRRTDSIVVEGTGLRLVTVIDSPAMDSIASSDSVGGLSGRLLRGAGKMAAGAMRMLAQADLERLKVRLETP